MLEDATNVRLKIKIAASGKEKETKEDLEEELAVVGTGAMF